MKDKAHQREHKDKPAGRRAEQAQVHWGADLEALDVTTLQRAVDDPRHARPADILALQRLAGNRAVSRLIQTKLTVGPVGDRYEREADRVAEQVMAMPSPSPVAQRQEDEEEVQAKPLLQRQEDEEEVQTKPLLQRQEDEEEVQTKPLLQRQEDEEEVQTKPARSVERQAGGGFEAGPAIENRLVANWDGGSPLPDEVRTFMEPRFGADFSGVRLHTGGEAVQMNRDLSAQAFTHGPDIYLGAGRYDPGSTAGKRLLAHELTHVVQQRGGSKLQRQVGARPVQIEGGLPVSEIRLKTVTMHLDFVRIKRKNIKWAKILLPKFMQSKKKAEDDGVYGHWWTEIGDLNPPAEWDPKESYGWWPAEGVGAISTFTGVAGALNRGGARDPDHGEAGEQEFHPVMPVDDTKSYDDVRNDTVTKIRTFARGYKGKWMWRFGLGKNCRTFQEKLMKTVGLKKGKAQQWLKKPPKPPEARKVGRPFQIGAESYVYELDQEKTTDYKLDITDPIEVLDPKYKAGDKKGALIHIRFKDVASGKEVEGRVYDWDIMEKPK